MSYSEIAACLAYAVSVWLAARNNVHTWWIGIIGSMLYGWVFWSVQLYADVTLQLFFIATSITGWIHWLKGQGGDVLPVRRTQASHFFLLLLCAVVVAWLRLFAPHLYQCLGPLAGFFDFDLQRSGTIHVDGKTYRKLVRLVSSEYPRGATVYDARFKPDRRFIFPVLD